MMVLGNDHPVQGRDPAVIRPGSHQIAQIDDQGARNCGYIDPVICREPDLEAWCSIVVENRQAPPIRMCAAPQLSGFNRC